MRPAFLLSWMQSPAARATLLRRGTLTGDPSGGIAPVDIAGRAFDLPHLGSPVDGQDVWVLCCGRTWLVLAGEGSCFEASNVVDAGRCFIRGAPATAPDEEVHFDAGSGDIDVELERWPAFPINDRRRDELVWLPRQVWDGSQFRTLTSARVRIVKQSSPYVTDSGASVLVYDEPAAKSLGDAYGSPAAVVSPLTAHATNQPQGTLLATMPVSDPNLTQTFVDVAPNAAGDMGLRFTVDYSITGDTWSIGGLNETTGGSYQIRIVRACY